MDPNQLRAIQGIALVLIPIIALIFVVLMVLPYWFIWKKAGFSPWFSLLMFVPFLNLVMLYVLAFIQWRVVPAPRPAYPYYPPYPPPSAPLPPRG